MLQQKMFWINGCRKEKLKSCSEYFKLLERAESFLKDSNRVLVQWSTKLSQVKSSREAEALKSNVEEVKKMFYFFNR